MTRHKGRRRQPAEWKIAVSIGVASTMAGVGLLAATPLPASGAGERQPYVEAIRGHQKDGFTLLWSDGHIESTPTRHEELVLCADGTPRQIAWCRGRVVGKYQGLALLRRSLAAAYGGHRSALDAFWEAIDGK